VKLHLNEKLTVSPDLTICRDVKTLSVHLNTPAGVVSIAFDGRGDSTLDGVRTFGPYADQPVKGPDNWTMCDVRASDSPSLQLLACLAAAHGFQLC
jgi:hypothetical protein